MHQWNSIRSQNNCAAGIVFWQKFKLNVWLPHAPKLFSTNSYLIFVSGLWGLVMRPVANILKWLKNIIPSLTAAALHINLCTHTHTYTHRHTSIYIHRHTYPYAYTRILIQNSENNKQSTTFGFMNYFDSYMSNGGSFFAWKSSRSLI